EPVARRERPYLVGADPVDQPIEVLANARLGARAVRRLEQHVNRPIELQLGGVDVSLFELSLAGLEMLVGGGDQRQNRVVYEMGRADNRLRGADFRDAA